MSLTRRGKWIAAASSIVMVSGGAIAFFVISGTAPAVIRPLLHAVGVRGENEPPPTCPLSGRAAPRGEIPDRPALAVKVENYPDARPQYGLEQADIVYEEPVEGGITRFIAVFQCRDGHRVEPVRSARLTDIGVLAQYGKPVFAYAGGANRVLKAIDDVDVVDVNYVRAADAYHRDESREAPHNLYSSTKELWGAAQTNEGAPDPVFSYGGIGGRSKRVREVHLPFSSYSDVYWRWSPARNAWLRWHGTVKHTLADGDQVSAKNVVVQLVRVDDSGTHDAYGTISPEVISTGSGKAYVFRGGRMIPGRWTRPKLSDVTTFVTRSGDEIKLDPGNTWVELFPKDIPIDTP